MRNKFAAKKLARTILGKAMLGEPSMDRGAPYNGDRGCFPDGREFVGWRRELRGIAPPKAGASPGRHAFRNLYIALAVHRLHEQFNLPATTRRGGPLSAADIVEEVCIELGVPISVAAIRKIWQECPLRK